MGARVIVTGGASGIGAETVAQLRRRGATVIEMAEEFVRSLKER